MLVAFVLLNLGLLAAGWVCLAWFASGCLLPAFAGSLLWVFVARFPVGFALGLHFEFGSYCCNFLRVIQ